MVRSFDGLRTHYDRKIILHKYLLSVGIVVAIVCGVHSSGLALTNEIVFSQFQFNFITPGARATALGGAFIGLADDATAVESNPAGLTILTTPEVSIELKHIVYTAEHPYSNPTLLENIDPETGLIASDITRHEFDDVVSSVPFVSAVYPYKRFVFSLYRQESVNYKSSFRTSAFPTGIPETRNWILPMDSSVDLTVTNYGIGAAIQLFEGLSLAVSPRRAEMEMKSFYADFFNPVSGVTDFSDAHLFHSSRIDNEDTGYSVNAGILWKPHPKVSLGAVYKSGPKFTVPETLMLTETFMNVNGYGHEAFEPDVTEFTLKVPDSFGVGVAFRPTDFLTVTLDVVHIQYEDLLEDFDIGLEPYIYSKENFTVDNATEVHAGVEYILPAGKQYFALRAGIYNDPDHTIRFTGATKQANPMHDIVGREVYPGGNDQIHLTGGLGVVFNKHFQIDTAANIAERNKQLSFSMVYRF
ncbi:MAG: hypothetical protein GY801_04255 [bacterium]|nr:hypothetical protein [bacterium]